MSSFLIDLLEKCESQATDILALRKYVRELESENARLRKENDDLTRLANIDAMMIFLSRNCSFRDCEKCDANPLCDEAVYLQGLYGIDKDLACDADCFEDEIRNLKTENAKLREYLTMACEVIDAAVAGGYNAADSSIKKMHTTLKDLGIEVEA